MTTFIHEGKIYKSFESQNGCDGCDFQDDKGICILNGIPLDQIDCWKLIWKEQKEVVDEKKKLEQEDFLTFIKECTENVSLLLSALENQEIEMSYKSKGYKLSINIEKLKSGG